MKHYPKKSLLNDIDSLYANIYDIHPYMFSVISRPEFEKELEDVKRSLKDSITIIEFHKQIAPLISKLGDGHTAVHFPMNELMEQHIKVFPFRVKMNKTDSIISITSGLSDEAKEVPAGAIIQSINGHDYKQIIDACLPLIEGELYHFKVEVLNRVFPFVLYPVINDTVFTLKYIYNGEVFTKRMQGIDAKLYQKYLYQSRVNDYTLSTDEKTNSAVIRFDAFGFDGDHFKNFLDSAFLLLKNKSITNLIIDLRYNGGGNSSRGDQLFQYISLVPFQQFGKTIVKISSPVKQRYGFPDVGLFIEEKPLIPLEENPLRFEGDVYVLTSNFTFSSATSFSQTAKNFKIAKIIGEETGGLVVCYGNILGCRLPNTGINYGVSWQKYYLSGDTAESKGGVVPDYVVPADQAMEVAMELILNKNNGN